MRERGDWEKSWDLCTEQLGQVGGGDLDRQLVDLRWTFW